MLYNHVVPCYLRFASSLVVFSRPHSCLDLVEIDLSFCSTSLPLASTRLVHSTFSSHCLLSSKQHRWIISAATTNFSSQIFLGMLGIEPGQVTAEASMLTIVLCCPLSFIILSPDHRSSTYPGCSTRWTRRKIASEAGCRSWTCPAGSLANPPIGVASSRSLPGLPGSTAGPGPILSLPWERSAMQKSYDRCEMVACWRQRSQILFSGQLWKIWRSEWIFLVRDIFDVSYCHLGQMTFDERSSRDGVSFERRHQYLLILPAPFLLWVPCLLFSGH